MRQWAYKLYQRIESHPDLRAALREIMPMLADYELSHCAPIDSEGEVLDPMVDEVTELLDELDARDRALNAAMVETVIDWLDNPDRTQPTMEAMRLAEEALVEWGVIRPRSDEEDSAMDSDPAPR